MRRLGAVLVASGVLGFSGACRHEPTVDAQLSRGMAQAVAQAAARDWRTSCAVTEGSALSGDRFACREGCAMLEVGDRLVQSAFGSPDAGPLAPLGVRRIRVRVGDAGPRELELTSLADGGLRCDLAASR